MPTLIHLPYSPWSEIARWALDLRHVEYGRRTYAPLLGEPGLRWRLGQWRGPVSVPVLLTDEGALADSLAIARWADRHGDGAVLIPADHEPDIVRWRERAQAGMSAGRALSLSRVLANPDAVAELIPRSVRRLGALGQAIGRAGVARTRRKYGGSERSLDEHQATLEAVLDELRAGLGGRPTLLPPLTFADLCCAQVLCFVVPPAPEHLRLGAANRAVFGDPALAARYGDLVAWRDALYASYRRA